MKVTFPHMGRVYIPLKTLFEKLQVEVVIPPVNNSEIKDLGYKYSPEYSCMPFKMILGNVLYSLEKGADTLVMLGGSGPCRFGYFAHLLNLIARDRGHRFNFICLEPSSLLKDINSFKKLTNCKYRDITSALFLGWRKLDAIDALEALYWKVLPYSVDRNRTKTVFSKAIEELENCESISHISEIRNRYSKYLHGLKPPSKQFPRVGIVGDIYTLNEPYSNHNVEMILTERKIETTRSIYTSRWVKNNVLFWERNKLYEQMKKLSKGYLDESIGGFALETIYHTIDYANRGYDGVLHIIPITCMPEIVSRQILQKISKEKNIPVMSITVDEHNDSTGFETRLEAFAEMLHLRSQKGN